MERVGNTRAPETSMRFLRLTFAFLLLALAAAFAQTSATPQNVEFSTSTYEAPAFYATFPVPDKDKGAVAYSSEEIKTKSGTTTTLHNYALSLHNDEDAFLVIYCDIPNTRSDTAALDQMLDVPLAQLANSKPSPKPNAPHAPFPPPTPKPPV